MAAPAYRVELTPPDLSPYRAGNTGIDYVTTFDSGLPGPHVMVNALTHGNELCGAIAVDHIFRAGIRPQRGKLTLSFANVSAYLTFDPDNPGASRYLDEDFNRLWDSATLDGPRNSAELRRARRLRPIIGSVDLLLDIHSMQHATAPLMLTGLTAKTITLARRLGAPELIVCDAGHTAGRRLRDYSAFADPAKPQTALLIECGQHWERGAASVALDVALRFLGVAGVLPDGERYLTPTPPQRVVTVTDAITVAGENFRFTEEFLGLEVIAKAGTVIAHDDRREIRTPYDDCVLIMPSRRLSRGQTAVRLGRRNPEPKLSSSHSLEEE